MDVLVSVIIPTYCGSDTLENAINSIINQTYKNIEIIVVDDNQQLSDERKKTENLVDNFSYSNLKYIKHIQNLNGAAARNTGIKYANGKYICFLDDDDFYLPNRIKESVNELEQNCEFSAVFCNVAIVRDKNIQTIINVGKKQLNQKNLLLDEMLIGTGSNLFLKKNVVNNLGGFDETFARHQDLEFLVRFFESYKAKSIDKVLIVKGVNGVNNIPNYEKFKHTKEMFFNKFEEQINRLTEQEIKQFFGYHYGILFKSALDSLNINNINYIINKINQYEKLNFKQKILIVLVKIKFYKSPVYNLMKEHLIKIMSKARKNNNLKIDLETRKIINSYQGRI